MVNACGSVCFWTKNLMSHLVRLLWESQKPENRATILRAEWQIAVEDPGLAVQGGALVRLGPG